MSKYGKPVPIETAINLFLVAHARTSQDHRKAALLDLFEQYNATLLAQRDQLLAALEQCKRAIDDNSRSAGVSVAGFNTLRKQLADAGRAAGAAIAACEEKEPGA